MSLTCSCCSPAAMDGDRSIESPRAREMVERVFRTPTPCLRRRYAVRTAAEVLVPSRQCTRIFFRRRTCFSKSGRIRWRYLVAAEVGVECQSYQLMKAFRGPPSSPPAGDKEGTNKHTDQMVGVLSAWWHTAVDRLQYLYYCRWLSTSVL